MDDLDAFEAMANDLFATVKTKLVAKDREIVDLNDTIDRREAMIDGLKEENDDQRDVINSLEEENGELKTRNEELDNDKYEVEVKLDYANKWLRESEVKNQSNQSEIDRLKGDLKCRDDRIKQLAEQNEALNAHIVTIKSEFETRKKQLKDEIKTMDRMIKIMDDDLSERKSELRRLEQQLKNSQKTVELKNKIKSLKLKIDQLCEANAETNERFAQKCDQLRELRNDFADLEFDHREANNEKNEYQSKCAELNKYVLRLKAFTNRTITDLRRSKNYYYMTNERNKRRLLAEKLHSRNHAKLIRKVPQDLDDENKKIQLNELNKLKTRVNKAIDNTCKQINTKTTNVKKRIIEDTDKDMFESRKRAKRVTVKRRENRVQCAHCDKDFVDTGNCQKHMTVVHMVDRLANNLDDTDSQTMNFPETSNDSDYSDDDYDWGYSDDVDNYEFTF